MRQLCLLCPAIFRSLKLFAEQEGIKERKVLGLACPPNEHSSGDTLLTPGGHLLMSRSERGPWVLAPLAA